MAENIVDNDPLIVDLQSRAKQAEMLNKISEIIDAILDPIYEEIMSSEAAEDVETLNETSFIEFNLFKKHPWWLVEYALIEGFANKDKAPYSDNILSDWQKQLLFRIRNQIREDIGIQTLADMQEAHKISILRYGFIISYRFKYLVEPVDSNLYEHNFSGKNFAKKQHLLFEDIDENKDMIWSNIVQCSTRSQINS